MPITILKSRDGRLDVEDQGALEALLARVKAGAPLHLHLHGGLVDEESGLAIANRLSGPSPLGFGLPGDWEQVYVVWRTGAFETLRTNWTDLFENDRLYKALLRKVLSFASGRLDLPAVDGRSGFVGSEMTEAEVAARLNRRPAGDPFPDLTGEVSAARTAGRGVRPDTLDEDEAALQARARYSEDAELQEIADDLAAALVFEPSEGRTLSPNGDPSEGLRMIAHLDGDVRLALAAEAPALTDTARTFTGMNLVAKLAKHLGKIVYRVIKRFRNRRDHGFYATVVEELARELYGDLVGAAIWGMMKRDAADHFKAGHLGEALLRAVEDAPSVTLTAHSAGSIWAAELISRLDPAKPANLKLALLAPAVRADLFAEATTRGGVRLAKVRMFTMSDDLERQDAVLGRKWAYVYPSSLLYLVSGLFEERLRDAFPDAPILGLQRFHSVDPTWVKDADQISALKAIADRFGAQTSGIVYSRAAGGAGLDTDATSHGSFDQDEATLRSARHFLTS